MALHYGTMFRECIRHQIVANSDMFWTHSMRRSSFTTYSFPISTLLLMLLQLLRELLTRHKSTVAEFLTKNEDWFFADYNSKLLESSNYITRRQAIKLLGDILLDRSNSAVMTKYVSSMDNLRILMNLLRESSKTIQIEAFHVVKLFVANQNKPSDIINILRMDLVLNLLMFMIHVCLVAEDESFDADKAQVVKEIASLKPRDRA
ncbi:unnamed protein product [Arabis nemorensis]|uniref:Uncharacterized protein n=1 Tax=Arabis nemorensis TaxID=586526 RepID=A0A565CFC2_9BRAS|nr:unnamed protein product [Arabis nemorensis]